MSVRAPLLVTPQEAVTLRRMLKRRITATPPLFVRETPDATNLSYAGRSARAVGGAAQRVGGGFVRVHVVQDGGQAGDVGVQCDYTYSIWLPGQDVATDPPLATLLTPDKRRTDTGEYSQAADGTCGAAYQHDGEWHLAIAFDEVEAAGECSV